MISLPIALENKIQNFYEGKGTQKSLAKYARALGYIITFKREGFIGIDCIVTKRKSCKK